MATELFRKLTEEKRDRILTAAYYEFVANKDDYKKASVKEIAASAEISVGSIYKYFDDKDDIFFTLLKKYLGYINIGMLMEEAFDNLVLTEIIDHLDISRIPYNPDSEKEDDEGYDYFDF